MKAILLVALCFLIALPVMARAEGGCPPGQYPQSGQGWQTCVPIPDAQLAAHPIQRWADKYQAIATDGHLGVLGVAVDQSSTDIAARSALSNCEANGGTQCKLEVALRNGCLAMVVGESTRVIDEGATKESAESNALDRCEKNNKKCVVYYSACSLPVKL